jgi:hypothetical protein
MPRSGRCATLNRMISCVSESLVMRASTLLATALRRHWASPAEASDRAGRVEVGGATPASPGTFAAPA